MKPPDVRQLPERNMSGLVLTYLVCVAISGVGWAALSLSGVLRWQTWVGLCALAGGVGSAHVLARIGWKPV